MDKGWLGSNEARIALLFRLALGAVFLWASYDKLLDPRAFALAVANYQLVPEVGVNLLAVLLPWLELACALLLISGQWTRTSSLIVALLLVVFMIAVGVAMVRGLDVSCGCIGSDASRRIGIKLLGQDALLLAMAVFLTIRGNDRVGWTAFLGAGPREMVVS